MSECRYSGAGLPAVDCQGLTGALGHRDQLAHSLRKQGGAARHPVLIEEHEGHICRLHRLLAMELLEGTTDSSKYRDRLQEGTTDSTSIGTGFRKGQQTAANIGTGFRKGQQTAANIGTGFRKGQQTAANIGTGFRKGQQTAANIGTGFRKGQQTAANIRTGFRKGQQTNNKYRDRLQGSLDAWYKQGYGTVWSL